jgi:diadenosine tetraphosphatase ApaH/serine/threonine PP2A family protein phosphatase
MSPEARAGVAAVLVAILSDIHANLAALMAVIAALPSVDELWCLGDLVGYGPDPNECVELVRARASVCVAGNHDTAAADAQQQGRDFNLLAAAAIRWTHDQLTPASLAMLTALPLTAIRQSFTLVHGSPRYPAWEYLDSASVAAENLRYLSTPFCATGHTHVPLVFLSQGGEMVSETVKLDTDIGLGAGPCILGAGSVGQPRDGDPRACFMLLDTSRATARHMRVGYDIKQTQRKMLAARLPAQLALRLESGY